MKPVDRVSQRGDQRGNRVEIACASLSARQDPLTEPITALSLLTAPPEALANDGVSLA